MPFLVAESPSGQILGYALVRRGSRSAPTGSPSRTRSTSARRQRARASAARCSARSSTRARRRGITEIVAVIADQGAEGSVALHEKLGFVEIGRMGRVGFKFDRWLGTVYLQKHLKPSRSEAPLRSVIERRRTGASLRGHVAHGVDEIAPGPRPAGSASSAARRLRSSARTASGARACSGRRHGRRAVALSESGASHGTPSMSAIHSGPRRVGLGATCRVRPANAVR